MNYKLSLLESESYIQKEEYIKAIQILQSIEEHLDSSELIQHQQLMIKILSIYEKLKSFEKEETVSIEHILLKYKFGKIKAAEELIKAYAEKHCKNNFQELNDNLKNFKDNEKAILLNLLGHNYYQQNTKLALKFFEQELEINSESVNAHQAISELNFLQGNIDKAIEHIRLAIAIEPTNVSASDNLIMMMHYTNNASLKDIHQEASKYLARCFPERQNIKFRAQNYQHLDLSINRKKLKIGFVSGDLRKHALYYWLKEFLRDDNFQSLEIYLYHNAIEDAYSESYKAKVLKWRNISNCSDQEAFGLIQEDQIDILIDLSGHTRFNRLGLFALKPAPLQITWLGQSGPMGVPQIDYMLVSDNQVKSDEERFFSEKIEYIKGFLAPYSFTEQDSHKSLREEIPYLKNNYISFGCANGFNKINKPVLLTWTKILKAVPDSKLLLKNRLLNDPDIKYDLISFFETHEINQERIILEGFEERDSYLSFYNKLDIALDPFPIGGGTTSLDTLSMGVPILTIYGQHLGHRFSSCMNYCLNLNELVCFSEEEYIRKAIELAHNPVKIQKLRSQILSDFKKSELCDVQGFANKFETMLFQIWKQESIKWNTTDIQSQKELFFNLCDQYYQAETNKDFRKLSKAIKQLQISFPEQDTTWFYSSLESVKEGAVEKAIFELRKALEIKADSKAYNNNLVMLSHYSSELSKEEMLSFAQNYYENFVKKFKEDSQVSFSFSDLIEKFKRKKEKIKVGFLSGDIKLHPIFFWISSLINFAPNNEFEIYVYANNSENEFAENIKQQCTKLTYVETLSAKELAEIIYRDELHILIDISGHTAFNKLEALALKPAPLQMTWLGQSGPMGIPEIDYMIIDPYLVRDDEALFFTEKICRMPQLFAPYPAQSYSNLSIKRSLAREDKKIVFGSFNHSIKINSKVLAVWADILNAVPNSVIFIKNMSVEIPYYKETLLNFFKLRNIDESRIILEARTDKNHYLESFSKIDIALDPFPFGGGTTTHETLMMSVPVVPIFGDRPAHRGSGAILYAAGFDELVAKNETEYKEKIIQLAQNPELIIKYKNTIREKYLNSAAANMQGFAHDFFTSLKKLWHKKLEL